uniref:Myosin_tail_1 domain-containing protein n=1 Tax=Gongylonema pulchrum TaxID=637853 RepID=A0A183CYX9_9BILA
LLKRSAEDERIRATNVETELARANEMLEKVNEQLRESRNTVERLLMELDESKRKEENERTIREQHESTIKNLKENLEETEKQLAELDCVRIERDRLVAELSMVKEDCEKAVQLSKQDCEQQLENIKKQAEQEALEMRKQCEMNEQTAKAELLSQMDEMSLQVAKKDQEIEQQKMNISSLERKLLVEEQNEKIISDLRATLQTATSERESKTNVCTELENRLKTMSSSEQKLKKQLELHAQEISSLQNEISELKAKNDHLQ